jgi:hypothetical protein
MPEVGQVTPPTRKAPHELEAGDILYGYTCLSDARILRNGTVEVEVEFANGDVGYSQWASATAPTTSLIIDGRVAEQ